MAVGQKGEQHSGFWWMVSWFWLDRTGWDARLGGGTAPLFSWCRVSKSLHLARCVLLTKGCHSLYVQQTDLQVGIARFDGAAYPPRARWAWTLDLHGFGKRF